MKKIMIICTEKTGGDAQQLFSEVLDSLQGQGLEEIVVVHNRNTTQQLSGVTNLFFKKHQSYEVASCFNLALDYCEAKYANDFILLSFDDDCIAQSEYVFYMAGELGHKQVHQAMLMYYRWPLPAEYNQTFTPHSWLHSPVESLSAAIKRRSELGAGMQLFGLIAVIWDKSLRGLRCDENYNGYWGMEDTDFIFQLLEKGCSIRNQERACAWHCLIDWKLENHSGSHEERMRNPNIDYFDEKWFSSAAKN